MKTAPSLRFDLPADTPTLIVPWICAAGGIVCLLSGLFYQFADVPLPPGRKPWLVGLCLVAGAVIGGCGWVMRHGSVHKVALAAGWTGLLLICGLAFGQGDGTHAAALGFFGPLVCAISWSAGFRAGVWMSAGCGAALAALTWAETSGRLPGASIAVQQPLGLRVITQALAVLFSLALGTLITRLNERYLQEAADRDRRLRSVLHMAPEWYWEMDNQFRFNHVSQASVGSADVAARTRLGAPPWQIAGFGLDDIGMDALRADLEARRPFGNLLLKQHDSHGRRRYARISGEPRYDENGSFVGFAGVGRDATREVTARRAVAASETRYRELFERTPSPLLLHRSGKVIDANAAALQLLGYERAGDLMGSDMLRHFHEPASRAEVQRHVQKLEEAPVGASHPEIEIELQSVDGRRRFVRYSSVRVQTAGGRATLSIFFDDTERREAGAALKRSEALLSHVVATSPDAIVLTDADTGQLMRVNATFSRLSGYSAEEAVGRTTEELKLWQHAADRGQVLTALGGGEGTDALPVSFVSKHGRQVDALLSTARFALDGRHYTVGTARDVTEVERLRREYEAMLKYAAVGIAFTRERRFLQTNLAWERMFGWEAGGLIGQPAALMWRNPEAYAEVTERSGPLLMQGLPFETEQVMRRKDDSHFLCRVRAQAIDPDDPRDSGTIWIAEDVTERRRVEHALAAARDAAEAANRAKSAFLANTSHEIRTPLNGLLGLARLALRPELEESSRLQYLRQILDSASNLSGIISDILDLSKIEAGKLTFESVPFDLRALLDALQRAYHELAAAHGLRLSMQVDDGVPRHVHGDALRTRQILSNYINNALKFTETGEIRLEVRCDDTQEIPLVRFAVTDTGCGMDAATLARMFKPFTQADESTTRRFGGTGLGLSICQELASLMGGRVGATSQLNVGSTFWAELPLAPAPEGPALGEALPSPERLVGARVLMVEDNAVNMMIAVATLEQWGVQVTQAGDGRAAVDAVMRAEAAGLPFHAVLMDVQMPVMGGHEAARLLRHRYDQRSLPIIALTAAALVSEREEAMASGMNEFLTKPLDPDKLRRALGLVIAESAAAP